MKKILCVLVALLMITGSSFVATGVDNAVINGTIKEDISEEKIISKVSLTDDFEADSVIVVLNNKTSKQLKEYTVEDFSEVSPISVENLTKYSTNRIKQQRSSMSVMSLNDINSDTYVDEDNYHQFLYLKLDKSSKENVAKCVKILEQRDDVICVTPNYVVGISSTISSMDEYYSTSDEEYYFSASITPNDEKYSSQWGLTKINVPAAWNITTGSSTVKVGVIDSGIYGNHPDLMNQLDRNLSMDFTGGNSPFTDPSGHGTAVAGIIGAQGNNSTCVTGVCWNVSLVSLKAAVYNSTTGKCSIELATLSEVIDYAKVKGISILNYSYVGKTYWTDIYNNLLDYNGLFVCIAGNDGLNISVNNNKCYPSCYDLENVISVANSTETDYLSSSSNYSSEYVDLAAPGEGIYTTSIASSGYSSPSGTSMAAPFVAGVAALLKSKYPGMDTEALKDYILSNVDVIPALNGKVVTGGRLNAYKALTNLKNYTVQYNANGGGGVGYLPTTMIYGCATPLNRNNFGKSGHSFVGWHAQIADTGEWYYTNGSNADWYTEGSQPNNYYKYTFSDGEAISRAKEPGKTMVMYAQWEKRFNIQFMGNNATSGTVADMVISEGQNYTLPSSGFTRTGCTLQYWYAKDADGNYYFSNNGDKIWHSMSNIPSGYVRTQYAPGSVITANDVDGIDYDETIYMYAYWQPNSGLLGDVNGDGDINVKDSTKIQSYVSGLTTLTAAQLIRADVDFSGGVNINDATDIQKYSSGVLAYFG